MLNLLVGCKCWSPLDGDQYFNVEMEAECYPTIDQSEELCMFLNLTTNEIVDDVVYCIDATTAEVVWEK